MMTEFAAALLRLEKRHPGKLDTSDLAMQFKDYLGRQDIRVEVRTVLEDGTVLDRSGWVGITTGWRPAFLLMRRANDTGSSDVLKASDVILDVKKRRR